MGTRVFTTLLTVLALVFALSPGNALRPAAASAASNPPLDLTVVALPPTVTPGNAVAFEAVVSNDNSGTMTNVSLAGETPPVPAGVTYVAGYPTALCDQAAPRCFFGSLTAGAKVTVTFVFTTPTDAPHGSDIVFEARAWSNQGPQQSPSSAHGEFAPPQSAASTFVPVSFTSNRGFARSDVAANVFDTGFVKQSRTDLHGSRVTLGALTPGTPVVVRDRDPEAGDCPSGYTCHGQVTEITIRDHLLVANERVKVEIRFDSAELPGGKNANNLGILVIPDVGDPYLVTQTCSSLVNPAVLPCRTVVKSGSSLLVTIWKLPGSRIRGV